MRKTKQAEETFEDNPLYHNTWKLLSKYRDVIWSLKLSVQKVKKSFEMEFKSSIDEFLESIYSAGAEIQGTMIEHHAKCIEKSNKMLKMIDNAVELLHTKHRMREEYYWVLYYTYISPHECRNVAEIIESIRPHVRTISYRTYYRYRWEAVEALSDVLWGYTSKECMSILDEFFPEEK